MPAVTTSASLDSAAYVSASPSGSLKKAATSTVADWPAVIVCGGIAPTASGARFAASTVTSALCVAVRPSGSVAVTVTVAVPAATAATVRLLPDRATDTTASSDDVAVYVRVPPSGSRKNGVTSTVTDCPAVMTWAGIEPTATGATGAGGGGGGGGGSVVPSPPQETVPMRAATRKNERTGFRVGGPSCRLNASRAEVRSFIVSLQLAELSISSYETLLRDSRIFLESCNPAPAPDAAYSAPRSHGPQTANV